MNRVLVVGLDGLEPRIVDRLLAAGELPHLARMRELGGYARVATTAPAQTPVAWSTVAVGTGPGGHGVFDFLRSDPETYRPEIALHGYEQKGAVLPPRAVNRRRGTPVWRRLGDAGVPATVLRAPCTFPPDPVRGRMLSGVAVPDLRGGFGTATVYTTEPSAGGEGERVVGVAPDRDGTIRTELPGPLRPGREPAALALEIAPGAPHGGVTIRAGGEEVQVDEGAWSEWIKVRFKLGPLQSARGQVRFFLARADGPLLLYASPVGFDPRAPLFPISHPWDYARELEEAVGPFHTLGMAEDHGGLANGRLDEAAFLDQCGTVFRERRAMFRHELDRLDEGLLFCVFDTPDRVQHMFWRFLEADHPANAEHGFDPVWGSVIDDYYRRCDAVVGEALAAADAGTLVMVLSDHGFGTFRRQVHLNRWLHASGLLVLRGDARPGADAGDLLGAVDWQRTRAFAVGLAGIQLNVRGRESRGVVDPAEAPALAAGIAAQLTGLPDPERDAIAIRSASTRASLYQGPWVDEAPDVVVGCAPGYRVSSATALGGVPECVFEDNRGRWSGDHVFDPAAVPGVLLLDRPFDTRIPRLEDVAPTILDALGVPAGEPMEGRSLLR